jgi:hypothetical protein
MSAIEKSDVKHVKGEILDKEIDTATIDSWRPSCPFCHAKWTDDMIQLECTDGGGGCETCGYGGEGDHRLEITCHACKRLIYVKEGRRYD